MRYKFDDLGWYQFEWLVQSLLKAELGLGVESWSSPRGDHGRDAYFDGQLAFPAKVPTDGPFVFQVKFVENANAAGADPKPALLAAVRKEATRIKARIAGLGDKWEIPRHYALVTNVVLEPSTREEIKTILQSQLPNSAITCLGGVDVANIVDSHPALRRSFPQLLSLRDLNALLEEAVSRDLIERSRAAVDASRDIVQVFVPTTAYDKAWTTLRANHFAVLYGPPEMGKTAIAWMVALAQLSQGWDAFLCQSPADFFRLYKEDRSQIFVADDAFGRTEYDPSLTALWEKDLGYVVSRLDQKHWLVLTSRRHLLERARQGMDLQGPAAKFPDPATVLIDAGKLSRIDKALMLYRHARYAARSDRALAIVRTQAMNIVDHSSFTPERIRRFISDRLPELAGRDQVPNEDEIEGEIAEAIRNPTRGMQLAFKKLSEPYKWFLISLLESGYVGHVAAVKTLYEGHCPVETRLPFESIHDQLLEAFVRLRHSKDFLTWVHPSCRDLVIDELCADQYLRHRFLETASREGLKIAFSLMGGPEGQRNIPMMLDEESWSLAEGRVRQLVKDWDPSDAADILTSLRVTLEVEQDPDKRLRIGRVLSSACECIREAWDSDHAELTAKDLDAFASASVLLDPLPELPSVRPSWLAATRALDSHLTSAEEHASLDPDALQEWVDLAQAIQRTEPRALQQDGFPSRQKDQIERCLKIAEDELTDRPSFDKPSEMREEASRLEQIANALKDLASLAPDYRSNANELADRLLRRAGRLEQQADEEDESEDENDDEREQSVGLDVRLIFSDL